MKSIFKFTAKVATLTLSLLLLVSAISLTFVSAATTGKTYYVAANGTDDSDGLSKEKPMSLFKANATMYKGGDKVLFKRDDTFYGSFSPLVIGTNTNSRLSVGAYGSGVLPTISMAKIVNKAWENAGNGFFKVDLSNDNNYSGIKNNSIATKDIANIGFFMDKNGKIYGERKRDASYCQKQYDFYCDEKAIYVKTDKNPFTDLGELKLAVHGCLVNINMGVNISDLHLEFSGYGVAWNSKISKAQMKFAEVKNCVIENLGGTVIDIEKFTRAGNGVELYDGGDNVTISNNIFRNIYDVAFTCQGNDPGTWRNITVSDNIITYCTQAIEFWDGSQTVGAGIYNLNFENNLCIKNGESWASLGGTPRLNSTDVLIYGYTAEVWQFNVNNNTFYHSNADSGEVYYCHGNTVEKFISNMTSDNNYIYHLNDKSNVFVTDAQGPQKYQSLRYNIEEWKVFSKKDANSTFTAIGDKLDNYKAMEDIAYTSQNYHEIAKAADDAGITVKLKYDAEKAVNPDFGETPLKDDETNKSSSLVYIIIVAAVVVVIVLVIVIVLVLKKKK